MWFTEVSGRMKGYNIYIEQWIDMQERVKKEDNAEDV
jgi:hypothetical protein